MLAQNLNLNYLVETSLKGVNRIFVLAFENDAEIPRNIRYYIPNVEITDNLMVDGKNFFDQAIKNNKITYENIRSKTTGQGDDYATGCLLDNDYFRDNYKMIAKDLSKQQALYAGPRGVQQISFITNLDRAEDKRIFFLLEEAKETVLDFS